MNKNILKIIELEKNFGSKKVLKSINLDLKRGEVVGLLGINGAGKTTLLKSIMGFLNPTNGKIIYDGEEGRKVGKGTEGRKVGTGEQDCQLGGAVRGTHPPKLSRGASKSTLMRKKNSSREKCMIVTNKWMGMIDGNR